MTITKNMIAHWIGSDHMNTQELLDLIAELANGTYTPEKFREDVANLWEETV